MIPLPLELRPTPRPAPAAAFLIPSGDPRTWLEALEHLAAHPHAPRTIDATRLFIIPASRRDLAPGGALIVPPGDFTLPPRALPYARLGPNLFIPADAALFPPATSDELRTLISWDVAIFHPALGLIGFDASESLAPAELLAFPAQRRSRPWNRAVPGLPPSQPLVAIEVEMPPSIQQILEEGRDDLATEDPKDLPPLPGEPTLKPMLQNLFSGPMRLGDAIKKFFTQRAGAAGAGAAGSSKPQKTPRPNFLTNALQQQREREIERLLHMLQDSPDEGLRHAIPLNQNAAPRGRAAPGAFLGSHDVNFNLRSLQGGGPIDPWTLAAKHRAALVARYRELATRELALGRHRRAAYILAELLGDLAGAASALKQGRLFREAAVIYRDNLKQVRLAAECLEEGGLLTEAIAIYTDLRDFEKAGDLYTRLQRPADADAAFRTGVDQKLAADDRLAAAVLLDKKLHAPDEAIAVLDAAWPDAATAIRCVEEAFTLRARLAKHDDTLARVAHLRQHPHSRAVPLTELLSRLANTYPDARVKATAADATRTLAAGVLQNATADQERTLVRAITALDTSDRLLTRDGHRFLNRPRPTIAPRPILARITPPELVRRFYLPHATWCEAIAVGSHFFAVGHAARHVHVSKFNIAGSLWTNTLHDFFAFPETQPQFLLAPTLCDQLVSKMVIHEVRSHSPAQSLVAQSVGDPQVIPSPATSRTAPLLGLAADGNIHWSITGGDMPALSAWDMSAGAVMVRSTHDLAPWLGKTSDAFALEILFHTRSRIPLVARGDHLFFAIGPRLVHLSYLRTARYFELPGNILHLSASDGTRIAAVAQGGGIMITADGRDMRFAEGMDAPITAFTKGGTLIARDAHELRLYHTTADRLEHRATFPMTTPRPIAILPTAQANDFITIDANGFIQLFRLT